jgi:hypothetical protein
MKDYPDDTAEAQGLVTQQMRCPTISSVSEANRNRMVLFVVGCCAGLVGLVGLISAVFS